MITVNRCATRGLASRHDAMGSTRGQALVEMALVLPVFLLVLFGLIDGARLVVTNSMVSQAAREAARLAAVQARWMPPTVPDGGCVATAAGITALKPGAHVCPADIATLKANVVTAANSEVVGVGPIVATNVYLRCDPAAASAPSAGWLDNSCPSRAVGDQVSVRVKLAYQPITPLAGPFFKAIFGSVDLSGSATMAIN
jgi:hypothetical protein